MAWIFLNNTSLSVLAVESAATMVVLDVSTLAYSDIKMIKRMAIPLEYLKAQTFPNHGEWILIAVYIVTYIVGVIGNALVCFTVWRNRDMRTVSNIFMVNLSVADLVFILICLPPALVADVTSTWFLGETMCKLSISVTTLSASVSIFTLSAISIERWYAICHPLRFQSTFRRTRVILIVIWLSAVSVALPELISATVVPFRMDTILFSRCYPARWNEEIILIFQISLMIAIYILPLFLIGTAYAQIAFVLWQSSSSTSRQMHGGHVVLRQMCNLRHNTDAPMTSRKKATKMLFVVFMVFVLCFLPVHILNILRFAGKLYAVPHIETVALVVHWATFFNSCINPIIYNYMSDKFRREFKVAVQLCLPCKRSSISRQRTMNTSRMMTDRNTVARTNSNINSNARSSPTKCQDNQPVETISRSQWL